MAPADSVTSTRDEVEPVGEDPDEQDGKHAELEVVADGVGVAGLGVRAADLLFEFFEAGFNFPSCAVDLDDFLNG